MVREPSMHLSTSTAFSKFASITFRDVPEPDRNGFCFDYSYRNGLDRNGFVFGPERNGLNWNGLFFGPERNGPVPRNDWIGMDQNGTNSVTAV